MIIAMAKQTDAMLEAVQPPQANSCWGYDMVFLYDFFSIFQNRKTGRPSLTSPSLS